MITIALARIFTVVLSILSLRLATQILTPQEFGKWLLLNSLISFFVLYFVSPIGHFINRHTHEWIEKRTLQSNFFNFTQYLVLVAIIASIGLWLDANSIQIIKTNLGTSFFLLIGFGILSTPLNQTLVTFLNMLEQRGKFTIFSVLTATLSLILSLLLTHFASSTAMSWLWGTLLAHFLIAIICLFVVFKSLPHDSHQPPQFQFQNSLNILSFSLPLLIVTGFGWLHSQGYRFLIEQKLGLEQLAFFGAGYSVAAGILAAEEGILNTYLLPIFYKKTHSQSHDSDFWPQLFYWIFFPVLMTSFFMIIFSDQLVRIFLSEKYLLVGQFISWAALCEALRIFANSFQLIGHAQKNNKSLVLPYFAAPLVTFLGLYYFLEEFKILAVGPSLLAGFLFCFLLLALQFKSTTRRLLNKKILLSLASAVTIFFLLYFISQTIQNSIIALTLGVVIYAVSNLFFLQPLLRDRI